MLRYRDTFLASPWIFDEDLLQVANPNVPLNPTAVYPPHSAPGEWIDLKLSTKTEFKCLAYNVLNPVLVDIPRNNFDTMLRTGREGAVVEYVHLKPNTPVIFRQFPVVIGGAVGLK